ncbi:aminopeptidase P family protein [Mesorhizobium sp. M00.F.Ca.ET.151.01.1.1]|nr:aminopeptidase P family protein [Mesorhizobium sp. M00.F.Ca.ET.151.01.1.1]
MGEAQLSWRAERIRRRVQSAGAVIGMTDLAALASAHRLKLLDLLGVEDAVVVATSPASVVYCSGYRSMGYDTDPGLVMAVVFNRQSWILVGPTADAWAATEIGAGRLRYYGYRTFFFAEENAENGLDEFRRFDCFDDAVQAAVSSTLDDKTAPVAVEVGGSHAGLSSLATIGSDKTQAAFRRARAIKDPVEIEILGQAARATERALRRALVDARAGVSELDLSSVISAEMIRAGLRPGFIVVTSGPRAAFGDAHASARRLEAGDFIRFDIGGTLHGYWSDIATTAVVGEPSADQLAVDRAVAAGQRTALGLVRPGVTTEEIFNATIEAVRDAGLSSYRRHHVGHGLGLESHEFPTLGPSNPVPLEPGMIINVEPPYYRPGWGGLMYEATLLVTETGAQPLTTLAPELIRLSA